MRARNIKPGFFTDEELLELPPLTRILFEGLWCLADREGRLPDKPKRIKIEVLPCDDCDVDAALQSLHDHGLILRYTVDGERYIQVVNFLRHQNPHMKEVKSTIPAPRQHHANPVQAPCESGASTDLGECQPGGSLIPDSGFRIPDSGFLNPSGSGGGNAPAREPNAFRDPEPLEPTVEAYLANIIGGPVNGSNADEFRGYQEVIDDGAIRLAIDDADAHKARSWAYIRTTLRRWTAAGIKTKAQAQDDLEAFRAAKARAAPIGRPSAPSAPSKSQRFLDRAKELEQLETG